MIADNAALGGFAFLAVVWGLGVSLFWMYVGWRAMKAHERLADAAGKLPRPS